ncbi:hypothetical protein NSQ43_12190 [Sporosarcina sp. FSL W8-0480]|uniref:hypothetical protein n=1 Tax=Sporosarcina sp. FSL W8-0480 TaxID=2954701 RepID=UPI0030DA49BF
MMKEILRATGIGCILAGGIIYFTQPFTTPSSTPNEQMQLDELQAELDRVKEELAIAQTITSSEKVTSSSKPASTTEAKDEDEAKTDEEQQTAPESITKIILTIEPGSNSKTVADRLERANIIDNAKSLESYLIENGLSGLIQIGEYEVDTTMDLKTIASIITKTK